MYDSGDKLIKELSIYDKLYNARTAHSKNLFILLTDSVEEITTLVIDAANEKLTHVDSAVLLGFNSALLKKTTEERKRFENEVKTILGMEDSYDTTT